MSYSKEIVPNITIISPVRNERAYIERVLLAIALQDYPAESMEVLIADGMSTDDTRKMIRGFSDQHPKLKISVLDNPAEIVPTAMNIALRHAKGEIIIRVDGHTEIAPDYVRQCVETLQRTHADNVGGKMNAIGSNPFGYAVALATSTPFGIGGGRFHYSNEEAWVDTVYMGAWPRQVFEKIGLFDEELIRDQDDEFNYRLREQGGRILLSPAIHSQYTVRSTPRALWRQYFQYGYWKVRLLQKHPRQMSLRQFVPPLFVASLLVSILYSLLSSLFSFSHPFCTLCPLWLKLSSFSFFITLLYLLANLLASIFTASKHGWRSLPLLPMIFAILHLAYGLGFLVGLVRFANRWGDRQGKVPSFLNEQLESA